MQRYKTYKESRLVTKTSFVTEEKTVPVWWYKFLLWLFKGGEEKLEKILDEERERAFWVAATVARERKERLMHEKLYELGYEVRNNFPMARIITEDTPTSMGLKPNQIWSIVKIKENDNKD